MSKFLEFSIFHPQEKDEKKTMRKTHLASTLPEWPENARCRQMHCSKIKVKVFGGIREPHDGNDSKQIRMRIEMDQWGMRATAHVLLDKIAQLRDHLLRHRLPKLRGWKRL